MNSDDIEQLPLWAAVGFAARCARLVWPHFKAGYARAPAKVLADVERAIAIAEEFARRGSGRANYAAEADGDHAVDVSMAVKRWAEDKRVAMFSDAAAGAAYAAGAAADVAAGASWARRELAFANAWRAVRGALTCEPLVPQIEAEFRRLSTCAAGHALGDNTGCPPEWLGKTH